MIPYTGGRYLPNTALLAGLLLCLGGALYGQQEGPAALPEGEGKELVAAVCTQCHGLRSTLLLRNGLDGWKDEVERMVTNGAQLSPEETDTVVRYLFAYFGPGVNRIQTGPFPTQVTQGSSLPAGAGKDLVESQCAICHDLGWVVNARKSRTDWEVVTENMMERGVPATPDQIQTMVAYLTSRFGKDTQ